MTLSMGARELRGWPRRRLVVAVALMIVVLIALAATTGLPPFGRVTGAGWRYPLLVGLSALMGTYGATAVATPVGAEMTLCDLRWPVLAAVGFAYAGQGEALATGLEVLLVVAAVVLMVWAVVQRLDRERAALTGDGDVCVTCRPLFGRRGRESAPPSASVIRPLAPAPIAADLRNGEDRAAP